MNLNNAWVVITGASRGIGVTIAEEFAKKKANLILIARSMDGLKKTCDQVENLGGKAHAIAFDLEKISQIESLAEKINKLAPHIDVLVNNAGLEKYCFFTKYKREDITSVLNVNLIAPMELTRLLLPGMLNRRKGHVINISSVAGKLGEIYNTLYDTSKGGMELWTDALRQELYKTGVKITSINPGAVSDAGMIYNIGVKYPVLLGACTTQGVADAVIKCTSKYKSRVFINSLPIKPFIIVSVIFPRLVDTIFRWLGITRTNIKKVEKRMKSDQQKAAKENKKN
ncbi:MAG: SDR family oxidoreductase [Desulfobacteraceae bacterium]|nr:SDR family oxidoreductase [Desulfobacteraceae bacterium]MBC2757133.1 SDR family oxidoreductase [Desulfobacteraceae bacterium]